MSQTNFRSSLRELLWSVAGDASDLVRGEIALSRAELEQKIDRLIAGVVSLFGAMMLVYAGLVIVLIGGALALSRVVPDWAAYLIVGGVVLVIGVALAFLARRAFSPPTMVPYRTIRNVQADARVIKEHVT
jgi:type II secretory pathway component PulF